MASAKLSSGSTIFCYYKNKYFLSNFYSIEVNYGRFARKIFDLSK